LIKFKKLREEM